MKSGLLMYSFSPKESSIKYETVTEIGQLTHLLPFACIEFRLLEKGIKKNVIHC